MLYAMPDDTKVCVESDSNRRISASVGRVEFEIINGRRFVTLIIDKELLE